jgi:hypothetical protein
VDEEQWAEQEQEQEEEAQKHGRSHSHTHSRQSSRASAFASDERLEGDENGQVVVTIHGEAQTMPVAKANELRVKVRELASHVPDSSLVGGRTFAELSLYEKKSVLVNNELE